MVVPSALNWLPPFENVSWMLDEDFQLTGPALPVHWSLMLNPLVMAVSVGAVHF